MTLTKSGEKFENISQELEKKQFINVLKLNAVKNLEILLNYIDYLGILFVCIGGCRISFKIIILITIIIIAKVKFICLIIQDKNTAVALSRNDN